MTARAWMIIAAAGSAGLLLAALAFQYLGEMPPCKLCYWQRYGHFGAVGIGVVAAFVPVALLGVLGAMAALSSSGIGAYHVGVEQGWWEGPASCSSSAIDGLSTDELLNQILAAPLVRCDEIPWEMFGLSMAGWNAVASLALSGLWMAGILHARRREG